MDKVRFGIIGIGTMGSQHATNLFKGNVPDACLGAVADIDVNRLAWAKESFGEGVSRFATADELIASGTVDAVIIATPHYFHPPIAIKAFEAGLNVSPEKPAGVYTTAGREMNEAAKKSGKVFGIMYSTRPNPYYEAMRKVVQDGTLGEIRRINWIITNWYRPQSYYDSGSWRATWQGEGGGVLLNQCPHNLDLWQWVTGMMPKRVRGFCYYGKMHNIEVEDDVTAYVEYENGATGVFVTSTSDTPGTNRFEITGDMGKMVGEDGKITLTLNEMSEREFNATWTGGFGSPKHTTREVTYEGKPGEHVAIMTNFTRAILYGDELIAPGYEGIKGLTISNAIHLSSWLDDWVELPLDEDLFYNMLQERIKNSKFQKKTNAQILWAPGSYGN
nr:Gfo/Idh/MocA family oxidoreductase [bacterium]